MARRRGSARRTGVQITVGVVSALALTAVGVGALVMRGEGSSAPGVDDVSADGLRAGAGPAAATGRFFKRVGDAWAAAERIEKLEKENQQLRQWRETALALSERMERYEALLKMPPETYGAIAVNDQAVSARLILDAAGPFKRTLLANAGADHGVRKGYIAVNENGLVGRVVALGQRSSRVLLLDDFNSRIPVMGLQSRVRAMLSGDASTTPKLETGQVTLTSPRLDHQAPANALRQGERVVTSGDGGVFPRGLLVGTAERGDDGVWRVRLSAASAAIDYVRLIPFAPVTPPELAPVETEGPPLPGFAPASPLAVAAASVAAPQKRTPILAPQTPPPPGSADDDAAPPIPDAAPAPPANAGPPQ
ncbi:MAG: rod shape-determining protein MreC [Hyphomonadaceae bacterium]|nr:rod shape-determining protein MreC [Hyphomonadaceae bacterium]